MFVLAAPASDHAGYDPMAKRRRFRVTGLDKFKPIARPGYEKRADLPVTWASSASAAHAGRTSQASFLCIRTVNCGLALIVWNTTQ